METWIIITITAAFLQNIRSTLQKHLKSKMGTTGATFVRFGFGLPVAICLVAGICNIKGIGVPVPNAPFLAWVVVAASAQIGAQALLVHMFSYRNFAVGTAYSRTEPAQAALFGLLFLFETVHLGALVAIGLSVIGVMTISVARSPVSARSFVTSLGSRTAIIGLASGALFGVAAVGFRAASLALSVDMQTPDFIVQAANTLLWGIGFQTIVMLIWIWLRERHELNNIKKAWKISTLVGIVGACASFGWFMAMTLQQAAVVKALAQIEMLFAFASTVFIFKEKINRLELIGCALIVLGIITLLLWRG